MKRILMAALVMIAAEASASAQMMAGVSATTAPAVASATVVNWFEIQPTDRVEGSVMAPITLIEYASLTCSHCADFSRETMPQLRKEWIESGKVKFVYRDLPWDNLALGMAKIARCAPPEQFKPLVESFFAGQKQIVTGANALEEIKKITRMAGMSDEQVDACVKDAALHSQLTMVKEAAQKELKVTGTPAIFVNGRKLDGAVPYKDLKKALEEEMKKLGK